MCECSSLITVGPRGPGGTGREEAVASISLRLTRTTTTGEEGEEPNKAFSSQVYYLSRLMNSSHPSETPDDHELRTYIPSFEVKVTISAFKIYLFKPFRSTQLSLPHKNLAHWATLKTRTPRFLYTCWFG